MMQLISLLKCNNNIKFPKFNYLMWAKVRPSHPPSSLEAVAPGGTCPPPGDCAVAILVFLLLTCVIYKVLSDALKVDLVMFLEFSSERIPW